MKKLSPRALTALCNLALAFIVLVIGAVCFLPSSAAVSAPAGKVYDRGTKPAVSLTINVYWGTDIVEKMLDLFREKGVRVTFFVGGCWADDNVPTVRRMAEEGHEVGSHGYFHREHDKLSLRENTEEIGTSVEFLSLVTGKRIRKILCAPPKVWASKPFFGAEIPSTGAITTLRSAIRGRRRISRAGSSS